MKRLYSIDVVRGIVMIVMVLDHTRDLIHVASVTDLPTNLQTTTPFLFLTRWITHFCAPTFVFLSGVSAYLGFKKTNNITSTRRFLLTRGLWLVVLEFTLVNFGIWFDPHFTVFIFDVIATIGLGFMALSLFLKASAKTILIIGLAIVCLHNFSSLIPAAATLPAKLAMMLVAPVALPFGKGSLFIMGYPPLPWLGVMLIGFAVGKHFELPITTRKPLFSRIGLAALAFFIVIRSLNVYGDSFPWAKQKNPVFTVMSFINITKYPPSLDFCLLTLGVTFILLSMVEGLQNKFTEITAIFGRTSLFYFLVHWYILHPLMFLVLFLQGYKYSDLVFGVNLGRPKGSSGLNLWYIYTIWLLVVILLYPICKWYSGYKESHPQQKWLRYL